MGKAEGAGKNPPASAGGNPPGPMLPSGFLADASGAARSGPPSLNGYRQGEIGG
jgi:hypothetical protein